MLLAIKPPQRRRKCKSIFAVECSMIEIAYFRKITLARIDDKIVWSIFENFQKKLTAFQNRSSVSPCNRRGKQSRNFNILQFCKRCGMLIGSSAINAGVSYRAAVSSSKAFNSFGFIFAHNPKCQNATHHRSFFQVTSCVSFFIDEICPLATVTVVSILTPESVVSLSFNFQVNGTAFLSTSATSSAGTFGN